jgi:hypothetical protein
MGASSAELDPRVLIPAQWLSARQGGDVRIYNPALTRHRGQLLVAYRVDSWEDAQCRIAVCVLDDHLQIAHDRVSPFSDTVQDGGAGHYDPRFLVYRDRLFIHYNNNFRTRPNRIFLVEVDPDTLAARSPARPLQLEGPRQEIEKNWMFFEHDGDLFAVYRVAPHTILRVDMAGRGPIACSPVHATAWDVSAYAERFGLPCGGTPPVRRGDEYVSFFHSRRPISRLRWVLRYWPMVPDAQGPREGAAARTSVRRVLGKIERRLRQPLAQVRYYAGAYAFAAAPPFRPLGLTPEPVLRPEEERPRQKRVRANPYASGVVYPCGAVPWDDGSWLVSYGVQDERCCLRFVRLPALDQNVRPPAGNQR